MAANPTRTEQLPSGRHGLPERFVTSNQRDRLLDATAEIMEERGYASTSVGALIAAAGVSRRTFYELFEGKEECFMAALDHFLGQAEAAVGRAYEASDGSWARRISEAIEAVVALLRESPAFAHLVLVEADAAGAGARARREAFYQRLAVLLDGGRLEAPRGALIPPGVSAAVVGGLAHLVRDEILAGRAAELDHLLPDLVQCALAPYLGGEAARALSTGRS